MTRKVDPTIQRGRSRKTCWARTIWRICNCNNRNKWRKNHRVNQL